MSVRAKFKCAALEPAPDGAGGTVRMFPVTSGSPENDQFFRYTPSGALTLGTINQAAFDQFVAGAEYYVDVSRVPPAVAPPGDASAANAAETVGESPTVDPPPADPSPAA